MDSKYRLIKNQHWIKESYSTLANRLTCFKKITIRVNIRWLRENDYIFVSNGKYYNKSQSVNWYSINYLKLDELYSKTKHKSIEDYNTNSSVPPGDMTNLDEHTKSSINLTRPVISYKNKQNNISHPKRLDNPSSKIISNSPSSEHSNEHINERSNENHTEGNGVKKSEIFSEIKNSLRKVNQAYAKTVGKDLTNGGTNCVHKWLSIWDADLIIIAFSVTDNKINSTREKRNLSYTKAILQDWKEQGIVTSKEWHIRKRQAKQSLKNNYQNQFSNNNNQGGTADDMKPLTFYQEMCQTVASARTGDPVFPTINDNDRRLGKILTKACYIIMKQKHVGKADIDSDTLAQNNCAIAKRIVKTGRLNNAIDKSRNDRNF